MFRKYVTQEQLTRALAPLERQIMATQQDIDTLTTEVGKVATDLTTAQTTLQAEIDALSHANPTLDLTALQAAVAPLDSAVVALGALTPTPPPAA